MIHLVQYEPQNGMRDDIVVYRTAPGAGLLVSSALSFFAAIMSDVYGVPHDGGVFAAEMLATVGIVLFLLGGFGCRIGFKMTNRQMRVNWHFLSVEFGSQVHQYDELTICIRHYAAFSGEGGRDPHVEVSRNRLYIMTGKNSFVIASNEYTANQAGLDGLRQKLRLDSGVEASEVSENQQ